MRNHSLNQRAAASLFVMGALVILVISIAGLSLHTLGLLAIVFSIAIPMTVRYARGQLDLFEPIVLANIALAVMFIGRPLADLVTGQSIHDGYSVLPTFDEALVVAFLGIFFLQLGYLFPWGANWSRRFRPPVFRACRAATAAWLYVLFGAFLFGVFLSLHGGFGLLLYLLAGRQASNNALFLASTGYLYNGILMWGAASIIFFALATISKWRSYWLWFMMVAVLLVAFYGARGARADLLPLVMGVPVFWYLSKQRRPRIRTIVIAALIGISLIGWLGQIRVAGERGDVGQELTEALTAPLAQAGKILSGGDNDMFDSLANELLIVPQQLPYRHGATVTDIFIRAVPRPLWPHKPLESNDAVVNALWPRHYAVSRASPAFSLIGPFYADSGTLTVVFGMYMIGVLLRLGWLWFQRYNDSTIAQIVYSMGLPFVVILMRGSIPDTLSRMLFYFVPLVLLMVLVRLRAGIQRVRHSLFLGNGVR